MTHVDLRVFFPIRTPSLPGGRWLIGLAILAILLSVFGACGVFTQDPRTPHTPWGPPLFFSVMIAYIVPIFGYIAERTAAAITALTPVLDASAQEVDAWHRRIWQKPVRWLVTVLTVGVMSGLLHNVLLYESPISVVPQSSMSLPRAAVIGGTQLIWIVVTLVVAGLLDNALLLNQLARRARIHPFDTHALRPFATVAVISTLALIGAQAAFPIMSLEGGVDTLAYIPGLVATGIPMLMMAALPIWPLHRRLVAAKRRMLADVSRHISSLPLPEPNRPEPLTELAPLLAYRREVAQIPEWPFDFGVVARFALYLIIPPLTWIGAALIENVVDALL